MKAGAIARCMQACRGSVAQQVKQALSLSNAEFSRTSLMLLKTCSKPDSSHVASIAKPKKSFKKSECSNFTKMSKLLLVTDSNFLNNIGDYKGPKIKNLEVKQCKSRKSAIEELMTIDEGIIVFPDVAEESEVAQKPDTTGTSDIVRFTAKASAQETGIEALRK